MPGYIIHLAAASILVDSLKELNLLKSPGEVNAFLVSCLIPDATDDKRLTHYRHTDDKEIQIRYPEPWRFAQKYAHLMKTPQGLGFLYHLYTDYLFYHEYFPRHILLCDEEGRPQVQKVKIKKTVLLDFDKKEYPGLDLFRKKLLYDDYTIFNAVLEEKYHLTYDFLPVENPGIAEAEYGRLDQITAEIRKYSAESKLLSSHETTILKLAPLLKFIEDCPRRFLTDYPYWV